MSVFTTTGWLDPLVPEDRQGRLSDLARTVWTEALVLDAIAPRLRGVIARLLRPANSYYTNLIEGHRTNPRDIERALRRKYSANSTVRDLQRLAVAHIEA